MTPFTAAAQPGEFEGRTALVTGAASDIGLSVARRLAAQGATVALADFDERGAWEAAAGLRAADARALAVHVDVTDPGSVREAIGETVALLGGLHLVVNTTGAGIPSARITETTPESWRRVVATHLDGVFYSLHYGIPAILASGGGAVVNLTSALGTRSRVGTAAYVAAQRGVVGLTRAAALEYAARGVRINAVSPGFIDTPLIRAAEPEVRDTLTGQHPVGRLGTAEEVAEVTAFLLSDRASFVHGSHYRVDGAYAAQ